MSHPPDWIGFTTTTLPSKTTRIDVIGFLRTDRSIDHGLGRTLLLSRKVSPQVVPHGRAEKNKKENRNEIQVGLEENAQRIRSTQSRRQHWINPSSIDPNTQQLKLALMHIRLYQWPDGERFFVFFNMNEGGKRSIAWTSGFVCRKVVTIIKSKKKV